MDYRELAKKNLDWKCNKCGKSEGEVKVEGKNGGSNFTNGLIVHHIDFNRSNNDLSNLEVLCHSCHNSRHRRTKGMKGVWKWTEEQKHTQKSIVKKAMDNPELRDRLSTSAKSRITDEFRDKSRTLINQLREEGRLVGNKSMKWIHSLDNKTRMMIAEDAELPEGFEWGVGIRLRNGEIPKKYATDRSPFTGSRKVWINNGESHTYVVLEFLNDLPTSMPEGYRLGMLKRSKDEDKISN